MRNVIITLAFLFIGCIPGWAQGSLNMNLLGSWDDDSLPLRAGGAFSDCWGYHDAAGNEYAVIGSIEKVHFFDITNPTTPVLVDEFEPGDASIWRDFKYYGKVMYGVADEGDEGLAMYDLASLPNIVNLIGQTTAFFEQCHNIFIDEATAKMYVCGADTRPGGLIVLDVTNSGSPTQLASVNLPGGYVHDLFARNDTVYCNHGNSGLYVYDFSTPTSPTLLGTLTVYPEKGYNHSSWLSADGDHLVFTDENHGRAVKIADVSNLSNISVTPNNLFESTLLAPNHTNSIAHNPVIIGDIAYISYYHDGIQLFDISNPDNVVRVGYYDTEPNNTNYNGYFGAWGVYPLLPSGNIIAADILHGLVVLEYIPQNLPSQLIDFQGFKSKNSIILRWETALEVNNDHFEVQRSSNGIQFTVVGKVEGAGNSNEEISYSFEDDAPLPGYNYYRLRQVDFDGTATYSNMIALDLGRHQGPWFYPNQLAIGETINLVPESDNELRLEIRSVSGAIVLETMIQGNTSLVVPSHITPGNYFIRLASQPAERLIITH